MLKEDRSTYLHTANLDQSMSALHQVSCKELSPEITGLFINDQALSWSVLFDSSLTPSPPPLPSVSSTCDTQEERQLSDRSGGEGGGERSRIIRPQDSLVLYNHSILSGGNAKKLYTQKRCGDSMKSVKFS